MAVVANFGNTNLSTANGFYRVEAHNVGMKSNTTLALSTTRTINVTFANACNLKTVLLNIQPTQNVTNANLKDVTVELKESGTTRASVTRTAASMFNSVDYSTTDFTHNYTSSWIVAFDFGTPYAVTTAAGVWTIVISQSGAGASNQNIRTSDGTNPFYIAIGDNTVSFASGDVLICDTGKGTVTIDQSATLTGLTGTGGTSLVCGIVATGNSWDDIGLQWENPASASYTLTLNGELILAAHGGFIVGSSGSRITRTNKAIIDISAPSTGTLGGIAAPQIVSSNISAKQFIKMYGEVPSVQSAKLANAASVGASSITIDNASTGWAVNDVIIIGGNTSLGTTQLTRYTITSVAGAVLGISPNITGQARSVGGNVVVVDSRGVKITTSSSTITTMLKLHHASVIELDGVDFVHSGTSGIYILIDSGGNSGPSGYGIGAATAQSSAQTFKNITATNQSTTGGTFINMFSSRLGEVFEKVYLLNLTFCNTYTSNLGPFGNHSYTDCITMQLNGFPMFNPPGSRNTTITNCKFDCQVGGGGGFALVTGEGHTFTGCEFWGSSAYGTTQGACVTFNNSFNGTMTNCTFNNNNACVGLGGNVYNLKVQDCSFGQTVAITGNRHLYTVNTVGAFYDVVMEDNLGTSVPIDTGLLNGVAMTSSAAGSAIRIINESNTANNDTVWVKYGYYQRTGSGLSDTTVRTSGGYAIRLQPRSGTNSMAWPNRITERGVPTGDIQNKTMTVSCWMYINNTAYDAGTYELPRLNVKYDNATTTYTSAAATFGSWQQVAVTFTPTTTYGQIDVWITAATDATGSNAYVYVDDFNIAFPAGVQVDLGSLDLWSNATPIWPPIATVPSLGGVWDEAVTAHTISGSFGVLAKTTEQKADDAVSLIIPT
jgi:hypothetical protein